MRHVIDNLTSQTFDEHVASIVQDAFDTSDVDGDKRISRVEFLTWAASNPNVGSWVDNFSRLALDSVSTHLRVEDFQPEDFKVM